MNDKPVIQITEPEVIEKENETIYDYDKSHVIYKMQDLGSFAELQKMKAVNQKYKEVINNAIKRLNDLIVFWKKYNPIDNTMQVEQFKGVIDILKEVK